MASYLPLPLLSYLLLPAYSTYSTSLNILFFYLTWSTLILSHPPLKVEVLLCLAIRVLFHVLPATFSLVLDSALPGLVAGWKVQGKRGLPSSSSSGGGGGRGGPEVWKVVLISIGNLVFGVALQAAVEYLLTDVLDYRSALKVTTTLPSPWSMAKNLLRAFLLREVLQYYLHRHVLHARQGSSLSSPLARWHQEWHHAVSAPYCFAAHYDHPLSWVLWRWVPSYLPSIILRTHLLTHTLFLTLTTLEETLTTSGYTLFSSPYIPFSSILLGGLTARQDLHARSQGAGNFAPWGVCDWIHGTTVGDEDFLDDLRGEAREHDLKGKMGRGIEDGRERVGRGVEQGREALEREGGRRRGKRSA
ncbi:MAG: hypothetical protein M1817_006862 [Caeruleum heppii]|nr:MAG: hypothetical protein M1817_006862 [Caeruleum heppii]